MFFLDNEVAFIVKDIKFDMMYFYQPSVDIDGYDPFFKRVFNEMQKSEDFINYNPTAGLGKRNGRYAYWTQTSPKNGAWVN